MTTVTKPVPDHIKSVQEDADEIGWDVLSTPTSVKITPPNGKKNQTINISLNPPPAPPQLQKQLADQGFLKALAAFQREQDAKKPKSVPAKKSEAAAKDRPTKNSAGNYVCPECLQSGVKEPFATKHAQGLGSHRYRAHGVVGADRAARAAAAAKKAVTKKAAPAAKKAAPKASVPAQAAPTAAEAAPRAAVPVNVDALPGPVGEAMSQLFSAVQQNSGEVAALQQKLDDLTRFRTQVTDLVNDGTKAPVQVVAAILELARETEAQ